MEEQSEKRWEEEAEILRMRDLERSCVGYFVCLLAVRTDSHTWLAVSFPNAGAWEILL